MAAILQFDGVDVDVDVDFDHDWFSAKEILWAGKSKRMYAWITNLE